METLALADESVIREAPGGWGQGKGASFQSNGTMAMCLPCGSILLLGTKISAYPNQENVHIKKKISINVLLGTMIRGNIFTSSTWFSGLYIWALRELTPSFGQV